MTYALALRQLATAVVLTLLPATVVAQTSPDSTPPRPRRVLSTNPFLPLAGWFTGEYEQRIDDRLAFAISMSHLTPGSEAFDNLDFKLRFYPNEKSLHGFSVAGGVGYRWKEWTYEDYEPCFYRSPCTPQTHRLASNSATISIEAHYQWLLGKRRSTAVTLGGGAKRMLVERVESFGGSERIVPTFRFSLGWAF